MTIQDAAEALETAATAEAAARQELERMEEATAAGSASRSDLRDAYEAWVIRMGEKQRAELELARSHVTRTYVGTPGTEIPHCH